MRTIGGNAPKRVGFGVVVAPALAAGVLRMARRRAVDHSMPLIPTPAGSPSTGPFLWAAAGIDIALLGSAPALAVMISSPPVAVTYVLARARAGSVILVAYLAAACR